MPVNYSKYPKNWKTEIRPEILKRADNKCEFCNIPNYSIGYRDDKGLWNEIEKSFAGDMMAQDAIDEGYKIIKIVLTIAHLDHNIQNNDPSNLKALCQKCHLNHDKNLHAKNAKATKAKKQGLIHLDFNEQDQGGEKKF